MNDMTTNPEQNQLARVSLASPDAYSSATDCATLPPEEPCTVVILGATGDLTARKLIPSLVHMYQNERLPESFTIVGCGRTRRVSSLHAEGNSRAGRRGRAHTE